MIEDDYERAIDEIIQFDFTGMYVKVVKEGRGG